MRRSKRARRLQVRVLPHGHAEVVVPLRVASAEVSAFIAASQDWIEKTRRRAVRGGAAADLSLPERIDLPAAAEAWTVRYRTLPGSGLQQDVGDDGGVLTAPAADSAARKELRRWLMERARRLLPPRVALLADGTGLRPAAVSIRRQRTRWGSCSAGRRINLNCAALFLAEPLVEYLIVHELCHLRHMDHSPRFWVLVGSFIPDYQQREEQLTAAWNQVPGWVFYGP